MKLAHSTTRALTLAAVATVALGALTACAAGSSSASTNGSAGLADGFGSHAKNRTAYFFTYYDPASDPFWAQIQKGGEDAAKLSNLSLTEQTASGDAQKMVDLVNTAIATKPAAIFMPFNEGEKWVKPACDAQAAGILVFAYNVDAPADGQKCVSAFVGQDFKAVGQIVGENLLAQLKLSSGDKVMFPAEEPSQEYAIDRGAGVQAALDTVGAKGVYVRTSGTDAEALNDMTAWLTANKDVKAIVPLGGTPNRNAVAAEKAAGVTVPIIGFDTSPQVVSGIKSGAILGTADQQGYVQGFQPVMQAALELDFGLSPANINSGGLGMIDKSNLSFLEDTTLQGVRY